MQEEQGEGEEGGAGGGGEGGGEERVRIRVADVSSEADCRDVVAEAVRAFGRVDVLVLNAAKSDTVLFGEAEDPAELMRRTIEVNLMQCVYFMKYATPHLLQSHGVVVPVSSIAGLGS
jgi:NAD(P)-dependent dehydrogenase (short-subunit alcohol dehydrogenase family)